MNLCVYARKVVLVLCCFTAIYPAISQKKTFDYSFYGFVRGDFYVNSRANIEGVDGLFYLYPKDILLDAKGEDLNATANGSFYTFTTRLGMDMKGPDIGTAKSSAKIETDFGGTNNMNFMLRVRQAYLKLAWEKSSLLLGQTWHPMFGEVAPNILNLSTGSPFQPFNRSPQINYQLEAGKIKFIASALYQLIYLTQGPDGKSEKYQKDRALPELFLGADFKNGDFLFGGGVDMISVRPRLQSVVADKTYKVDERANGFSYDLHAKYTQSAFQIAGKTIIAENQTHNTMISGFGVTSIDELTGKQEYVPFRHSTSWLNLIFGKKYQGGIFAGYTKNLGTSKKLIDENKLYGAGLDIDQFVNISLCAKYVLPHWNLGLEYTNSTAWYGKTDLANGKVKDTHDVTNHRLECVFMYFF